MSKLKTGEWFIVFTGAFFGVGLAAALQGEWISVFILWGLSLGVFIAYCNWLNKDAPPIKQTERM